MYGMEDCMDTLKEQGASQTGDATPSIEQLEKELLNNPRVLPKLASAYIEAGRPTEEISLVKRFPGCDTDSKMSVLLAQAYFDSFQNDLAKQLKKYTTIGIRIPFFDSFVKIQNF